VARLRAPASPAQTRGAPPVKLTHPVIEDWVQVSERPPDWWSSSHDDPETWPTWRQLMALHRFLIARRAWLAEHHITGRVECARLIPIRMPQPRSTR
jgi:hypothetical protein